MSDYLFQHPEIALHAGAGSDSIGQDYQKRGDAYLQQFKDLKQGQNQLPLAIDVYIQASELINNPDIMVQTARAYMLNGQFGKAAILLEKALQNESMNKASVTKALESKAFLQFRHGEIRQAKETLKQALRTARLKEKSKIHLGLTGIQLELVREKASLRAWASCVLHTFLGVSLLPLESLIPNAAPSLLFLFNTLAKSFRSQEQLLESYLDLYQSYPGMEPVLIEIGKLYSQRELYAEAEFWFCRALYRYPSRDDAYRSLANLYRNTNNIEQLTDILRKWLLIRPNNGEILLALSQTLAQHAETYDEALLMAKKAVMLLNDPVLLANAYIHLGNLYSNVQAIDTAIMAYQAAINSCPENLDTYIQLGTLYYDKQEYDLSQKIFEKALKLSPRNAKILCNLGYLAWMQNDVSQALTYYHHSIALDPTYDIALNNLGVLYLDHIGDIQQAMMLFDQALLYNPEYALCHYNKGRAFSFLGETIEAARCFMQAQELNKCSNELDNRELTDRINQLFENPERMHPTDL